jgi:hypothetical protein
MTPNAPTAVPAPRHFTVDVEADGPCPGLFSMISFAVVPVDAPERAFYVELAPLPGANWRPEALAVSGFTREQVLAFAPAAEGMAAFRAWAATELAGGRGILVSDNPGFDAGFLTYYCEWAGFANPFGHSCRRLGDLCAGMLGRLNAASHWKRWTQTAHTHHALDDARKMAEGFTAVVARLTSRSP